ncbi:hypothetical protein E1B28_002561 [Marasmius oreades]|uniref:Uncharacterized protein n=1 Tax=Marasmius oreades TaxID=181124 RepID=A0A9P7RNL6_9AGAR|nr:uncharacterized protein E1B28_002561 [Marasmius oreades]KAG7086617.1 hypothetical protein E1B28_002561 [Marasmius oreades]
MAAAVYSEAYYDDPRCLWLHHSSSVLPRDTVPPLVGSGYMAGLGVIDIRITWYFWARSIFRLVIRSHRVRQCGIECYSRQGCERRDNILGHGYTACV